MENKELALLAAKAIDSKKGIDIKVIDIAAKSSFADYLIVAGGSNDRQVGSIADAVEDEYEKIGITPRSIAGKNNSGWILMDYGDIVVNIFNPELRSRYNLENVWGDCEITDYTGA
ncbi:MAG: ribosome silencing factor [Hornefia sp.]|nr:ribosome silencing factor [Hornefia sp.]